MLQLHIDKSTDWFRQSGDEIIHDASFGKVVASFDRNVEHLPLSRISAPVFP